MPMNVCTENCPARHHQPEPASTTCIECTNHTVPSNSSRSCSLCPPGSYSLSGVCRRCLPGFFNDNPFASACTPCSYVFFHLHQLVALELTMCWWLCVSVLHRAGRFASLSGQDECAPCQSGTFSTGGTSDCSLCAAGKFSPGGSDQCHDCPTSAVCYALTTHHCQRLTTTQQQPPIFIAVAVVVSSLVRRMLASCAMAGV